MSDTRLARQTGKALRMTEQRRVGAQVHGTGADHPDVEALSCRRQRDLSQDLHAAVY